MENYSKTLEGLESFIHDYADIIARATYLFTPRESYVRNEEEPLTADFICGTARSVTGYLLGLAGFKYRA